jgi:carotenoid cleavage dioxygenase
MDYAGFNAPSRIEADIYDLVVAEGEIPTEINGAWFRSIPDPQYPPMLGDDTFLSGDGMVARVWFENGHCDYRQRYIMTDRLKAERKARRGLHGKYRNPFTDDPSVAGLNRTASNTTPIWHGGRLLALKEDGRAHELHPETLETIGAFDFGGKLRSQTMTAHTRYDPETGELHFYGYQADGLASKQVAYCVADKDGELIHEEWFEGPYSSLMHDFMVTREHVIFPFFPLTADLERMKAGGHMFAFDPAKPTFFGVMRRGGSVKDMRWFRYDDPAVSFHFMNGFSEGDKVFVDFGRSLAPPFPFMLEASGMKPGPSRSAYVRWELDLAANSDAVKETDLGPPGDMPRVADKDVMRDYEIGYYQRFDPEQGPPNIVGPVGPGFNTISRINVKTGELRSFGFGPRRTLQEHIHIPSKQQGHEGYLAFVVDLHETMGSEIWLMLAERPQDGPIARIEVPMRLRCQVHGNWVAAESL